MKIFNNEIEAIRFWRAPENARLPLIMRRRTGAGILIRLNTEFLKEQAK